MTKNDYALKIFEFLNSFRYVENTSINQNKVKFSKQRDNIFMSFEIWTNIPKEHIEEPDKTKLEIFYKNQTGDSVRQKKSVLYDPNEESFDLFLNKTLTRITKDFERVYCDLSD
jgi:hypothetical protein